MSWQNDPVIGDDDWQSDPVLTEDAPQQPISTELGEARAALRQFDQQTLLGGIADSLPVPKKWSKDAYAAMTGLGTDVLGTATRMNARGFAPATMRGLERMGVMQPGTTDQFFAPNERIADSLHRQGKAFEQAAQEGDSPGLPGMVQRGGRNLVRSLPPAIVAGRGGPYAAIAPAVATSYSTSLTEGKDAGLEGPALERYAVANATAEGLISAAFQKIGLGGNEAAFARKEVTKGIGNALKEALKQTGGELGEESLIAAYQKLNDYLSGVDPEAMTWERIKSDAAQLFVTTLMGSGAAQAPNVAGAVVEQAGRPAQMQAAQDERLRTTTARAERQEVARNDFFSPAGQEAAKAWLNTQGTLADTAGKESLSRQEWQQLGLPPDAGRSAADRKAFLDSLKAPAPSETTALAETVEDIPRPDLTPLAADEGRVDPATRINSLLSNGPVSISDGRWTYQVIGLLDDKVRTKGGKLLPLAKVASGEYSVQPLAPAPSGTPKPATPVPMDPTVTDTSVIAPPIEAPAPEVLATNKPPRFASYDDAQKAIDSFEDEMVAKYGEKALNAPPQPLGGFFKNVKIDHPLSDSELSRLQSLYAARDGIEHTRVRLNRLFANTLKWQKETLPDGSIRYSKPPATGEVPSPSGQRADESAGTTGAEGAQETEPTLALGGHRKGQVPVNLTGQSQATRQVAAHDVVKTMERDFGTTLRYGRVPAHQDGNYSVWAEVARVQGSEAASLYVETHEIAHDVDKKTDALLQAVGVPERHKWLRQIGSAENQSKKFKGQKVLDKWADRLKNVGAPASVVQAVRQGNFPQARTEVASVLGPITPEHLARAQELLALDYKPGRQDIQVAMKEGFAEFTRHFLTTDDAKTKAPNLYRWFTQEWLPANPKYAQAYVHAKTLIDQYRKMTPEERAAANKAVRGEVPEALDVPFGERALESAQTTTDWLRSKLENRLHVIRKLESEAQSKGLVRQERENTAEEVLRWADQKVLNHVKNALLGEGIYTIRSGKRVKLAPSLLEIFDPLRKSGYGEQDWDTYHVAQHVLDIKDIRERQNAQRAAQGLSQLPQYNAGIMTYDEAQAIVDRVNADPAKRAVFEQTTDAVSKFSDAILDMRADAGEIPQALADQLKQFYKHHASLLRVHPNTLYGRLFGRKTPLNVGGRVHRRSVKGSGLPVMPQTDALVQKLSEGYYNAMIAVAKQHVLGTVVKNPSLGFNAPEGLGHWAQVVPADNKPSSFTIEQVLKQLVDKHVIEDDDAKLIRAVARLRNGSPSSQTISFLGQRYGTTDEADLLRITKDIPNLDDLLTVWQADYSPDPKNHIERIYTKDGKPILVQWNPDIYEMFENLGPMQLSAVEKVLTGFADTQRLFTTGINYVFGVNQLVPDALTGVAQAKEMSVPETLGRPFYTAGLLVKGLVDDALGKQKRPSLKLLEETYGSLFEDFAPDAAGMQMLHRKLFLRGALDKATAAIKEPATWGRSMHNAIRQVGHALSLLDLPVRLAEGQALMKRFGFIEKQDGKVWKWYNTRTQSFEEPPIELERKFLAAVSDVTVPFGRGGTTARYLNRVYFPYLNPSIQGTVRMAQTVKAAALGDRRAIAGLAAFAAVATATSLLFKLGLADREEEEEKEQWYKSQYWSAPWGKFRKPQSWAWMPNIVEASLDIAHGKPGAWKDYAKEELRQGSYFELPGMDNDPILGNVAKLPAVGPIAEAVANRDTFRDKALEPGYMESLESGERYDERTGAAAKAVGQVTGPALDLGPKKVEHVANRMLGGVLSRDVVQNPLRPYKTSVSKDEFTAALDKAESQKKAADYHGKEWTADDELRLDRLTTADKMVAAMHESAKQGKLPLSQDELYNYSVGIARHALGKEPLARYPDPFNNYGQAPDVLKGLVNSSLEKAASQALRYQPTSLTDAERERGVTMQKKTAAWQRDRNAAVRFLSDSGIPPDKTRDILFSWLRSEFKSGDTVSAKANSLVRLMPSLAPK